jgi:hypothetical protein
MLSYYYLKVNTSYKSDIKNSLESLRKILNQQLNEIKEKSIVNSQASRLNYAQVVKYSINEKTINKNNLIFIHPIRGNNNENINSNDIIQKLSAKFNPTSSKIRVDSIKPISKNGILLTCPTQEECN